VPMSARSKSSAIISIGFLSYRARCGVLSSTLPPAETKRKSCVARADNHVTGPFTNQHYTAWFGETTAQNRIGTVRSPKTGYYISYLAVDPYRLRRIECNKIIFYTRYYVVPPAHF